MYREEDTIIHRFSIHGGVNNCIMLCTNPYGAPINLMDSATVTTTSCIDEAHARRRHAAKLWKLNREEEINQ